MQITDLIPWGRSKQQVSEKNEAGDNPLVGLQRDINRVFDDFWSRFERPLGAWNGPMSAFGPVADVSESEEAVEIAVELPGLDENDIDVSLTDELLTIRGEKKTDRKEEKKGYYLAERSFGSFYRTIALPPGVDTDQARAEFRKGVLTISLPRTAEAQAKVRKIEVKAT